MNNYGEQTLCLMNRTRRRLTGLTLPTFSGESDHILTRMSCAADAPRQFDRGSPWKTPDSAFADIRMAVSARGKRSIWVHRMTLCEIGVCLLQPTRGVPGINTIIMHEVNGIRANAIRFRLSQTSCTCKKVIRRPTVR